MTNSVVGVTATALTKYVLVVDRGDARAADMPVTAPVKHMLAGGFFETRTVDCHMMVGETLSDDAGIAYSRRLPSFDEPGG